MRLLRLQLEEHMKKSIKVKKLTYQCAKCFKKDALKLAWFFGSDSIWDNSLLCNECFKKSFNSLPIFKKKEWGFYDRK